jgi:hypothetical protein
VSGQLFSLHPFVDEHQNRPFLGLRVAKRDLRNDP